MFACLPDGGAVGRLHVGVLKRLSVGVSFGGEQLIGTGAVDWNPRVGLAARCRIIEEGYTWPALLLGFDSQGIGPYRDQRYQVKSKGIYLALSKNYTSMLGELGVHAGVNMSREDANYGDWSAWLGIDKSLRFMALFAEYDLGRNNGLQDQSVGEGYLNVGGAWTITPQLRVAYYLKNALGKRSLQFPIHAGAVSHLQEEIPMKILAIALLCVWVRGAVAQEERAIDNFAGVGVRAMGMGGAFVGVADDFTAMYWNPAGLAQMQRREVQVSFLRNSRANDSIFNGIDGRSELTNTRFGSLGFVYPYPVYRGSLVLAAGFNRIKDFDWNLNQKEEAEGLNEGRRYLEISDGSFPTRGRVGIVGSVRCHRRVAGRVAGRDAGLGQRRRPDYKRV